LYLFLSDGRYNFLTDIADDNSTHLSLQILESASNTGELKSKTGELVSSGSGNIRTNAANSQL
jgi:hypothetical protein